MTRCSLSRIVLMCKVLNMGTPEEVLAKAMDPPNLKNIALTILTLKQVIHNISVAYSYYYYWYFCVITSTTKIFLRLPGL